LKNLSCSIWAADHKANDGSAPIYPSFQDSLDAVYEMSKQKKIVFVLDEYPYLANSYKAISSLLQVQLIRNIKKALSCFLLYVVQV